MSMQHAHDVRRYNEAQELAEHYRVENRRLRQAIDGVLAGVPADLDVKWQGGGTMQVPLAALLALQHALRSGEEVL